VHRRLREIGKPPDWAYEIVAVALLGGLIGARGYWLLQNHESLSFGNVLGGSGLIWYGGLAGGIVGVLLWAWRRDFLGYELLDLAAPVIPLGYALGRIGCQLSGDGDYGIHTSLPWGMAYPHGTVPDDPARAFLPDLRAPRHGARGGRPGAGGPDRPLPRPRRHGALPRRAHPPQPTRWSRGSRCRSSSAWR
jgi:phosphatidylglycerol:prolipoprotein diacylglycerol transferase